MKNLIYLCTLVLLATLTLLSCKKGSTGDDTTLYDVTVTMIPSGTAGTISPAPDSSYEAGQTLELTAIPAEGFRFYGWGKDTTSTDSVLSLTVDQPYNLTAAFVPAGSHEVTVLIEPEGTGSVIQQVVVPKAKDYEWGTKIQLTPEPAENYEFKEWREGRLPVNTENPREITITEPRTLTAVFRLIPFITINTSGPGSVSMSPEQPKYGEQVTLTATPDDDNYGFVEWQGDVSSTDNPLKLTVDGPKEVTAVFGTFYLAENGVTILCPEARVGDKGTVGGREYTKRYVYQITPDNAATTCTSGIRDMSELFWDALGSSFNQDISHWDVSSVTTMAEMFNGASDFNADLSAWDVSSVTDMSYMFAYAEDFNQDLSGWDVSNVEEMHSMFRDASSFNQNIGSWDVSNVETMSYMFNGASYFDQDLSDWCVSNVGTVDFFATDAGFSNPDSQLPNWDSKTPCSE